MWLAAVNEQRVGTFHLGPVGQRPEWRSDSGGLWQPLQGGMRKPAPGAHWLMTGWELAPKRKLCGWSGRTGCGLSGGTTVLPTRSLERIRALQGSPRRWSWKRDCVAEGLGKVSNPDTWICPRPKPTTAVKASCWNLLAGRSGWCTGMSESCAARPASELFKACGEAGWWCAGGGEEVNYPGATNFWTSALVALYNFMEVFLDVWSIYRTKKK